MTGPPCNETAGRLSRQAFVRTCQQFQKVTGGSWTFLETRGIEPTKKAAERALRQPVIQRKISHGIQSRQGAIWLSRLLTVTTTLRQQGRDIWEFWSKPGSPITEVG